MKGNGIYLAVFFGLLIFIGFLKEVFFYVNESLSSFVRSLYVLPWIAIVIFLVYFFLKKIEGINPWEFLGFSVFIGMFISIFGLIINSTIGTDNILEKNYVGVYGTTEEYNSSSDSEVYVDHKTNVYRKSDKRANRELKVLENEYGESYSDDFIFWQTAFATGFEPKNISDFNGEGSFGKILTLFFTVGPIFLLETFINSFMGSWILMFIPIIGLFFKKRIFGKLLKPFSEYFENRANKTA